jgi:hypothetical protein
MENDSPGSVLCASCNGKGLIVPGNVCPRCDGAGGFPQLRVALKILSVRDVKSCEGSCFRRMAVLSVLRGGQLSTVHVVTDSGIETKAVIDTRRLSASAAGLFHERGWWS